MVEVEGGRYFKGSYNETQASGERTLGSCKQRCLNDSACLQITFARRPKDPCAMYQTLSPGMAKLSGTGWVKCATGSTDAMAWPP